MRRLTSEGLVLKKKNLPGADILVTFFSLEAGKILAMAKGAKKITSRRASQIQTGNLVRFMAAKRHEMYYLSETHTISAFSGIKKDRQKLSIMYFLLFMIDRLLPENQREVDLYEHTKKFIVNLAKGKASLAHLEEYTNELLMNLGFIENRETLSQLKKRIEELTGQKLPFFVI